LKSLFARNNQNLDRRPTVAHGMRQFQPIHTAGHLDIREKQSDISPRFQEHNRLVRIPGLYRKEPRFLDHFYGKHAEQRFVLDNEDDWQ
jgi:hypothetical protein